MNPFNFHEKPVPGKISISLKKDINNKKDLSLAYSPGVGEVSKKISENKDYVYKYTGKGNLVGVITNGSAVLGLGNIGPLAAKPVMEGKAALFKKFAGIDAFDIEIEEPDPKKLVDIIISLKSTFGGINLEDIKSPECFYVEKKCIENMDIPIFHDDQHGTAVVISAALLNSLKILKKKINKIKVVVFGAGAASLSSISLLIDLGLKKKNIFIFDLYGPLYRGRKNITKKQFLFSRKKKFSRTKAFTNSDLFIGLSSGNILEKKYISKMCDNPIVFALANPIPEIMPEEVIDVKKNAIIATGRSDYFNQVNNLLCFPYIFRAALDLRSKKISKKMKMSAVKSISKIGSSNSLFSKNKILPDIFEKKLITDVPYCIAKCILKEKLNKINVDLNDYKNFLKEIKL
ncbi:NAD(P)-dependent malic enzyme [Candidatus Vidania fulgoroideorum]